MIPNFNFGALFAFLIVVGIVIAQFLPLAFRILGRLLIWVGGLLS